LGLVLMLVWILIFSAYSPPERLFSVEAGQLDWIAMVKLVTRIFACLVLGITLLRMPPSQMKRKIFWCLLPFGLFAGWAVVSTSWSPLKAVSLGHSFELFILLMLSAVTGLVCVSDKNLSRMLFHLSVAILAVNSLNLVLKHIMPVSPNLEDPRYGGFMHPTLAGVSSGAALLIVLCSYLIWRWDWSRYLIVPSLGLAGYFLYFSHSRTAIAATIFALAACLFFLGHRHFVLIVTLFSITIIALLIFDPSGSIFERTIDQIITYTLRSQSVEQFMSASGRTDVWEIGRESFLLSPFIGHGYWMLSPSGTVFIWGLEQWQSLHNVILHVLAGTGLVGGILFLWALLRPLNICRLGLKPSSLKKRTASFALIVFAWFFIIGLYEISFLGAVNSFSIFFFITLGIAAGRLNYQYG